MSLKVLHAPAVQGGTVGQTGPFNFDGIWFTSAADYNTHRVQAKWPVVPGVPPAATEPSTQAAPHSMAGS